MAYHDMYEIPDNFSAPRESATHFRLLVNLFFVVYKIKTCKIQTKLSNLDDVIKINFPFFGRKLIFYHPKIF